MFLHLAGGNIRFLLELVHQSLLHHFQEQAERALDIPVDPKTQTLAAQQVGRKNLNELEGIGVEGAKLTKLLLGLGRVFEVLAEHPVDHAPEINQFSLAASESSIQEPAALAVDDLLRLAVMHSALVRSAGTKLIEEGDTRAFDYMIHPVFAPFFIFSHRRKRKLPVTPSQLLGLIENPGDAIRTILGDLRQYADEELPEQLLLFEGFYRGVES